MYLYASHLHLDIELPKNSLMGPSQILRYTKLSDLAIGCTQISTGNIELLFLPPFPMEEERHRVYRRHPLRTQHVSSRDIYDSHDQLSHELFLILTVSVNLQDSKNQKMDMKSPISDLLHMMELMLHGTQMNQRSRVIMLFDSMRLNESISRKSEISVLQVMRIK